MIRDLVSFLNYSDCAEVALMLFVGTFFMIFFGAFRLSKNATDKFAAIPLNDQIEEPRSE